MTEDPSNAFADRLIEAESHHSRPASQLPDPAFRMLLEHERRVEARVLRSARIAWTTAFSCLLLFAVAFFIIRNADDGLLIELTRSGLVVVAVTGAVALAAATVSSISWLFRSRTPTLRAIDRRLAALERLLIERRTLER